MTMKYRLKVEITLARRLRITLFKIKINLNQINTLSLLELTLKDIKHFWLEHFRIYRKHKKKQFCKLVTLLIQHNKILTIATTLTL